MATYYVESLVKFSGYIEADSQEEAEEKGWYYDELEYESVYEIKCELDTCNGCLEATDECVCDEESEEGE